MRPGTPNETGGGVREPYRLLDLFSGIGGFSLGLEAAGFRTVAFCEISAKCRHLLNHHWPEVPAYDDVCSLTAAQLGADGIGVDAICGGFPCQDISFAGKGAGLAGERSGLWREYARLIRELRPRYVVVENVAALLGRGLGDVLGDLAALGYDAWWDCIPASAVGAPHRRDRLWLVAYPGGVEHEGFGHALRRAVAEELLGADWDAGVSGGPDAEAVTFDPDAHGTGPHRAEVEQFGSAELRDEQDRIPKSLGEDVADAQLSEGERQRQHGGQILPDEAAVRSGGGSSPLAAASGARLPHDQRGGEGAERNGLGAAGRAGWSGRRGYDWRSEPDVGRVAHGVPARVDRLHGLGNAVVPAIPELIGRAIMAAEIAA